MSTNAAAWFVSSILCAAMAGTCTAAESDEPAAAVDGAAVASDVAGPPVPAPAVQTAVTEDQIQAAYTHFIRLREEGRDEEAVAAALQAADLSQKFYGDNSIELATPLINLAIIQSQTDDLSAAEQNYRAAIMIIERHDGMLSSRLINPLSGLGHTYNRAGMHEQAITSFERALRLNNIELGFKNFEQFGIQDGLTAGYVGVDDYEEANFYQEAQLEIHQRKFGPEDPRVVPGMYKLADWYDRTGNIEQAALTYRSADRILREFDSETSLARADALLGLAGLYERQGNSPAAASTLRKAVRIIDENPAPDPVKRAEVRVALGDLYTRDSRPGSANSEYTSAWADLSISDDSLDQRTYYFSRPVRLSGGPFPTLAKSARGVTDSELATGVVVMSYSIDSEGMAQAVTVIESDPSGVMEKQLLKIYDRSLYRPRYDDGAAVGTDNLLSRHEFRYGRTVETELEDEEELPRPDSKRGRLEYPGASDAD